MSRSRRWMRPYWLLWSGQLVSLVGSGMTGFALGLWVFEETGSATRLALIAFATALPAILVSPLVGTFVGRWDRRRVMLVSDAGAALCTLSIVLLLLAGQLATWHIYLCVALSSLFAAFQWPAYLAAAESLLPERLKSRGEVTRLEPAVAQVLSGVLGGALVGSIRIEGVILVDVATYAFALVTLLLVRIPRRPGAGEGGAAWGPLLREATAGLRYVAAQPGLLRLLLLSAATYFVVGVSVTLFTPLVYPFAERVMWDLLAAGGAGWLTGSLLLGAWGGPRRRVLGLLGFTGLLGLFVLLAGVWPSVPLVAVAAFGGSLCALATRGPSQALWHTRTPLGVRDRVLAVRRAVGWTVTPFAYLVAGPLADHVFEPLLAVDGPLAGSVGRLIGVGPGRGTGLLFCLMGAALVLAVVAGRFYPRLWLLEDELPAVAPPPVGDPWREREQVDV